MSAPISTAARTSAGAQVDRRAEALGASEPGTQHRVEHVLGIADEAGATRQQVVRPGRNARFGRATRPPAGLAPEVRDAQDVLDAMLGPGLGRAERLGPPIDRAPAEVLAAVEMGADACDAVAAALDVSGAEAAAALADLEAHGYVTCSLLGTWLLGLAADTGLARRYAPGDRYRISRLFAGQRSSRRR